MSDRPKLPWPSRFMALQYKLYDNWRHRGAYEVAETPGTATDLSDLEKGRQCLFVSFKRSGEGVPTPVNYGYADGKIYFRSEPHVAKMRRVRNDPHVRVCRCTMRGKPKGPATECVARELEGAEAERAHEIVASNWRLDMKPIEKGYDAIGVPAVYVEVSPAGHGEPA